MWKLKLTKGDDMLEKLKRAGNAAMEAASRAAVHVGDLNGDGKVDEEDAKIAADWAKRKAVAVGTEAEKMVKDAAKSDLAKDAATGAVVGAAIAIPVPLIGPMVGAAIGGVLGAYKNLSGTSVRISATQQVPQPDRHAELLKLQYLREKNVLSEEEFQQEKKKLLEG